MRESLRRHLPLLIVGLVAVIGIAAAAFLLPRNAPDRAPVPGLVQATEIKIAPEISGRMKRFSVRPGDLVHRDEVVAELDNPELAAAVAEAKAAVDLAKANRDRLYAGPRQEQVDSLGREVEKARSNLVYARQQLDRTAALASRDNASKQDLDKAAAAVADTQAGLLVAQGRFAEAQTGATAEERATADAKVADAEAALAVLERRLEKSVLRTPVDGRVQVIVAEPGEAIVPGQPVMTVIAAGERWFTFNLREDRLDGITIGGELDLRDDAGKPIRARVTEMRGLDEFATWRAARAVGDHDLNTFLVRADPRDGAGRLEPGMTVWLGAR